MAEPPAKRAKRTDSSAMWERNSPHPTDSNHHPRPTNGTSSVREKRDDRDRHHGRDDRRYRSRSKEKRRERSRSREKAEKPRRERSHSREKGGRRHRDGERDGARERDRRDRARDRSREKHRSRRDEPPSRRSRSPRKDHTSTRTRTRTPPRVSKPVLSRSPRSDTPAERAPPTGPRSAKVPPAKAPPAARTSSPKPNGHANGTAASSEPSKNTEKDAMEVDADSDPEMAEMRKAMGFTGFKSTKNTKVKGNNVSGMRKEKKTEYRQYMNRVGGFNRPLSPSR